ncbi:Protein SpAN [Portunus trituberculatus]|uniref:Metalloendopeptidase n=1 Tax=Portunus trituberculatus TaxID=210409 RepID=A0A5B7FQN5_PORTR|nr:Protein SpAN [Portunus trituberculatus]
MGFYHEQSRPERDDYVVVSKEHIQDNRESNFNKYSTNTIDNQNVPYDYTSDMHYGPISFTINGKTTLATKDPLAQGLIGQRSGLSHRDKHLANIMYKCIGKAESSKNDDSSFLAEKWLAKCEKDTDPCQNGGYYGANCACVCPPGTSGANCETETGGYYGFKSFCGTDIASGRSITSTGRDMILYFRTKSNFYTGWSAELTFEKQEDCQEPQTTEDTVTEGSTTVSTTAESVALDCKLENYNGVYYWSSPNFGNGNYPNSFSCGVAGNGVLNPSAGEQGTITASRHERICDYRIVAPAGSEVRIDEISPKILRSPNCRRDWLTVNDRSEIMYPKETSSKICGSSKVTSPKTSTNGEMYIAYKGSRKSQGFALKYTIV